MTQLPVVGFNSGKYDINTLKEFLMPILAHDTELKFTIKKLNSFMCLSTPELRFLDVTNFLALGFNYDAFLKAYGCTQTKGFFPYEWFDSLEKLNATSLPPREAFHSRDPDMQTMRDFLEWYNNRDVEPFCEALQKMSDFWQEKNIDML